MGAAFGCADRPAWPAGRRCVETMTSDLWVGWRTLPDHPNERRWISGWRTLAAGESTGLDAAGWATRRHADLERRTEFTNRASSAFDGPRTTRFMILRLTTRKASDATDIVLSSSLFWGLSGSSCRRLNMAKSASGTSWANFSGSVSSRIFSKISFQETNLRSVNESPPALTLPVWAKQSDRQLAECPKFRIQTLQPPPRAKSSAGD